MASHRRGTRRTLLFSGREKKISEKIKAFLLLQNFFFFFHFFLMKSFECVQRVCLLLRGVYVFVCTVTCSAAVQHWQLYVSSEFSSLRDLAVFRLSGVSNTLSTSIIPVSQRELKKENC